ncbi:MAG TPA: hypothetical protein VEH48_01200 [Candidatus Nitrosopolaris sp.]|nr:hypothetical protein [Candidatus Nitrosopolaris sp.]
MSEIEQQSEILSVSEAYKKYPDQRNNVDLLAAVYHATRPRRFEMSRAMKIYLQIWIALAGISMVRAYESRQIQGDVRPEVKAQFERVLKPEAISLGKIVVAEAQDKRTMVKSIKKDKDVEGGVVVTVDEWDGLTDYQIQARMLQKAGNPEPGTTYEADAMLFNCDNPKCKDPELTEVDIYQAEIDKVQGKSQIPDGHIWSADFSYFPLHSRSASRTFEAGFSKLDSSLASAEVQVALSNAEFINKIAQVIGKSSVGAGNT